MTRLLAWPAEHPWRALGLVAAITVALALQVPGLEVDTSVEGLMVEGDPARGYYEEVKRQFGSDTLTAVLVESDDVFTPAVLAAVRRFSEALEKVEGVTRVESLTTVRRIRGIDDTLDTDPLVGHVIPTAPAELARVRADAFRHGAVVGNLVSRDGRATAIVAYTDATASGVGFNRRFSDHVERLIAAESAPGLRVSQVGEPLLKATYGQYVERDQITLMPLAIAVLFVILLVALRSLQGAVVPTVTGGLSVVWTLGAMRLAGLPLNALTVAVPALLIAIGFAEDVHMVSAFRRLRDEGASLLEAIRGMIEETALPILVTTGTTVVGFLSLVTTDISILAQFGQAAALGLAANYVVMLLTVPAMLTVWPPPRRQPVGPDRPARAAEGLTRLLDRLAAFNLRRRVPILAVAGVLAVGSLAGLALLRVNTDFLNFFPEDSPVRRRFEALHRALAGGLTFYVVVETGRADGMKDPELLQRVAELQLFLAGTGRVDKSVSVADYLITMHREMNGGDPTFETIPETPEEVAQYLLTLEGKELAKYLDFQAGAANIVVRHNLSSSWDLAALLRELDGQVARLFPPTVQVRATGETILVNRAADFMAVNELTSFSVTLLIIAVVHAFLFMSARAGLLSLVPNVLPILYTFGLMGFLGIPLNTGTAMVATVAIGIAVDDTVHHMVTYSRELNERHDQTLAMLHTMRTQGPPIIFVSLALAGGFLVLTFSRFVPTVHVGFLSAVVMLVALAAELVLTPILMYSTRLTTLWDMVALKLNPDLARTVPLLRGMSRWEARKVVLLGALESFGPGQVVIHKGAPGTDMYMLVSGRARVFDVGAYGHERTLEIMEPGAVFGEVGLVGVSARTATVVAETPAEVLRLDFKALERLRQRFPFTAAKLFRNIARVLAERLRDRTEELMTAHPAPREPRPQP